jgi:hypothetical protein
MRPHRAIASVSLWSNPAVPREPSSSAPFCHRAILNPTTRCFAADGAGHAVVHPFVIAGAAAMPRELRDVGTTCVKGCSGGGKSPRRRSFRFIQAHHCVRRLVNASIVAEVASWGSQILRAHARRSSPPTPPRRATSPPFLASRRWFLRGGGVRLFGPALLVRRTALQTDVR